MSNVNGLQDSYAGFGFFIDGRWVNPSDRERIVVVNPANEQAIGTIPHAVMADIDAAIDASVKAFPAWRETLPWERGDILKKASVLIRERSEALAATLTREQGKPLAESRREVGMAADHFEWAAEEGRRIYGTVVHARPAGTKSIVYREPVGVVAAFTPWNFPALQLGSKVPYALAAGCTVILKPSEETPGISMGLVQALHDAGLPAGAINVIVGDPSEISTRLLASPAIRAASFTGSTAVGKTLATQAAGTLQRLTMELGGHAPMIVLDDADPEEAAVQAAAIKFRNAGQACVSPSRFYVHSSIVERFTKRLVECARALKLGDGAVDGTSMGPLANQRRLEAIERLIADATANGAVVACGGSRPKFNKGFFFEPTVLVDVPEEAAIMNQEPFGPIAPIASFTDLDDAIRRANRLPYGLAAYVFTKSAQQAEYCAARIEAGMVGVNNFALATVETPFGGVKESGYGREGGQNAVEEYLSPKLVKTLF